MELRSAQHKSIMTIPKEVKLILEKIEENGFEAFAVGGCVRDLLMGEIPQDWDITTNAKPEELQTIFPDSFYENAFGTVGIKTESDDESLRVIEATTYRTESKYSDQRHPDAIKFATTLAEDLQRRDFTFNALALNREGKVTDLFEGQGDLKKKIIRAVGDPRERFSEDALRMMRAIRLATTLEFTVEPQTFEAIKSHARLLEKISRERIRDEFFKIISADTGSRGIELLREANLLPDVLPELLEGVGVEQNLHHIYTVWEHNLRALQYTCDKKYSLAVRFASLLHDVGKPKSRRFADDKHDWTFHGHEVVGAKMTKKILEDLKFSCETIEKAQVLVRWHMFFSDPEKVTLSAVRRVITNVGKENIQNLVELRICDRIGTGRPKEQPFRLRKYQSMIEQALRDPISVNMLAINGSKIMEITGERPGPRLGWMLHALLPNKRQT